MGKVIDLVPMVSGFLAKIPNSIISLLARVIMATIFWKSAMTKIVFDESGLADFSLAQVWNVLILNWSVADSTFMLFEYEYDLPVIPFELAAYLATAAEILLPIAILLGLLTRYAALGMLAMTLVIQIFVYPNLWVTHGLWAIALLVVIRHGGGRLSVDNFLCKKCL